jgi:hypothetical protein
MYKTLTGNGLLAHLMSTVRTRIILLETVFPGICLIEGNLCNKWNGSKPTVNKIFTDYFNGRMEKDWGKRDHHMCTAQNSYVCCVNFLLVIWIINTQHMFTSTSLFRIKSQC